MIVLLFIFLLAAHAAVDRNKIDYTVREMCAFQLDDLARADLLLIHINEDDASNRAATFYTIKQQSPGITSYCQSWEEYVDMLILGVAPDGRTYTSVEKSFAFSADQRFRAIITEHNQGDIITFVSISTQVPYKRHTPTSVEEVARMFF